MLAFALTVALFGYWGILGSALLAVLGTDRRSCQRLLVAPAVGIAVVLLPTFWLNRAAGVPVGRFGSALALGLLLASLAVLAWRRPLMPFQRVAAFGPPILLAGLLTGRPMLAVGFDWLSYANDDMANYTLLAQRVLTRGLLAPPDLATVAQGLDHPGLYSTYHMLGVRPGPELLLAGVVAVTGLNPHQAFMPCIVAFHLALVGALCALVYQTRRHRPAALVTGWLVAVNALASLGVLFQLLAQVLGLALLSALTATVLQPAWSRRPRRLLALGLLFGVLGSALAIAYPEILPFGAIASVLYLVPRVVRRRIALRALVIVGAPAAVMALAALNAYLPSVVWLLGVQRESGMRGNEAIQMVFPYYLVPSGLAQAVGFLPIGGDVRGVWVSVAIALGALVLSVVALTALRLGWRGEPVALITATMLTVGIVLFSGRAAFGLFKLAFFLQPFMLATAALGWLRAHRAWAWTFGLIVVGLTNLATQAGYVERSRGVGSLSELRNASSSGLLPSFRAALAEAAPTRLDLDTANVVLAKLQALYLDSVPASYLSQEFFGQVHGVAPEVKDRARRFDARVEEAIAGRRERRRFPVDGAEHAFSVPTPAASAEGTRGGALSLTTGVNSVFNRRHLGEQAAPVLLKAYPDVSNHLVFMQSDLGQHYYTYTVRRRIALYQIEADPYNPGRTMAGVGRHLLFRVVNPGAGTRLALDLTTSFKGDGENRLPPAVVIGASSVPLPLVGRGSARVCSAPVTPRTIGGSAYLALDMGVEGAIVPVLRRGLMALYGRDVLLDSRYVVGFARDISLVNAADCEAVAPPRALARFPGDLGDPALEYSGIFEDGWVSGHAYVQLARPPGGGTLRLRGRGSPALLGVIAPQLTVSLDGRAVAHETVLRDFAVEIPVPPGAGRVRVDLQTPGESRLPAPDSRLIAFRLRFIGFEP